MEYKKVVRKVTLTNILRRTAMRETMQELHYGQEPMLEYLAKHGPCSQQAIADFLHVSPASVAVSTNRMEKHDLITKKADPNNRRQNIIEITEKGQRLFNKCDLTLQEFEQKMFRDFSQEDIAKFEEYYDRILFNLIGIRGEITKDVFMAYVKKLNDYDKN